MNNLKVRYSEDNDKLIISVPNLSKIKGAPSSTGKSVIIASTDRFESLEGAGLEGYTLQLMLIRPRKAKKVEKDDEPVAKKKKRKMA